MSDVEVAAYCKCSSCTVLVVGPTGTSWIKRRRRKVYLGANAVNEEDPERDRATQEEEEEGLFKAIRRRKVEYRVSKGQGN